MEKTRAPVENDRPAASLLQTLSHIVVSSTPRVEKQSPQKTLEVTYPELLQKNIDIEGNKFIHCA
jgi:hypothetical protein